MLSMIKKYPWVCSVFGVVMIVQIFELILMVRMYGLFTKVFAQPYTIETFNDILFFGLGSIYSDFFLYGLVAFVFSFIGAKLNRKQHYFAYHFFFITITISLVSLIAKYKALSYISDTLNFTIAKNIAGGSLLSALKYVANEAAIIGFLFLGAMFFYWFGYRLIVKFFNDDIEIHNRHIFSKAKIPEVSLAIIVMIILSVALKYNPNVRYGLTKKSSYGLLLAAINQITDIDRDGYGYFAVPEDENNFDSSIHPGAVDFPENGTDEDSLFGDFIYKENNEKITIDRVRPKYKYVFLIVLESARSDMMTVKMEGRSIAPNVQKLAQIGTIHPNVYSHTGFTHTSLKALFNGSLVFSQNDSLFQLMKQLGYRINIFSGQAEDFGEISKDTKMRASADVFFDASSNIEKRIYPSAALQSLALSEDTVVSGIQNFMEHDMLDTQNFFYINFQGPHFPYTSPNMPKLFDIKPIPRGQISPENKDWLQQTYWNSIAVADNAVGQLVETMRELNIYDESLIIITSDHGESLFDDGVLGHGHRINDNQLKIPLIVNIPQVKINSPLGQTDLRNLIIDSVNGDPNLTKTKQKIARRPAVFHLIGTIESPILISHTYENERLIFDFRTKMVMFDSLKRWQQINELETKSDEYIMLQSLIYTWEEHNYLQWIASNEKQ